MHGFLVLINLGSILDVDQFFEKLIVSRFLIFLKKV